MDRFLCYHCKTQMVHEVDIFRSKLLQLNHVIQGSDCSQEFILANCICRKHVLQRRNLNISKSVSCFDKFCYELFKHIVTVCTSLQLKNSLFDDSFVFQHVRY